jgi:predicted RNase H-like HicB family nuclease
MAIQFYHYRVLLSGDPDTEQVVVEIPALGIAEYGQDVLQAIARLSEMLRFHLDCLQGEGKPIPQDQSTEEGLYLRVRSPAYAA